MTPVYNNQRYSKNIIFGKNTFYVCKPGRDILVNFRDENDQVSSILFLSNYISSKCFTKCFDCDGDILGVDLV